MIYKLFQLKILNFEFFKVIFSVEVGIPLRERVASLLYYPSFLLQDLRRAISGDILTL